MLRKDNDDWVKKCMEHEVDKEDAMDRCKWRKVRERLGIDDITLVLQQNRLRWYALVLRKEDDWMKLCMEYEVEGRRPKRTWRYVV